MYQDLFQKQYDFELEQRNGLTSATNIPMVAITVVASAVSVIVVDFHYAPDIATYGFSLLALATLGAISFSVYSVFRSFWNYDYKKLPRSADLRQHSEDLLGWYIKNGSTAVEARPLAEADFLDYLTERIAEATDWNGQNNVVRGNYLHRATAAIALGVALLLPTALLYAHNKLTADEKVHQVRLVAPIPMLSKELLMSSKPTTTTSGSQPAATPTSTPAPAPAAKPSGPPNLVFKGNSDLAKPSAGSSPQKK